MIKIRDAFGRAVSRRTLGWIDPSFADKYVFLNGTAHDKEDVVIVDGKAVSRYMTTFARINHSARSPGKRVMNSSRELCHCGSLKQNGTCYCSTHPSDLRRLHAYHCRCVKCTAIRTVDPAKAGDLLLGAELELMSVDYPHNWHTDKSTIEGDASLPFTGGEVVTSPMLFEEHRAFWESKKAHLKGCDAKFPSRGIKSPDIKNSLGRYVSSDKHGLHVHVNRVFLSNEQWLKLIFAVLTSLKPLLTKIGGRNSGSFRMFPTGDENYILGMASHWVNHGMPEHAWAFSANSRTIEFRFPLSSSKVPVIIGRIGMVESLVKMTKESPNHITEADYMAYLNKPESKKRWPETLWLANKETQITQ